MIPLPTSLRVSVATSSRNSPCICCCTNVQYQVTESRVVNNNGSVGDDLRKDEEDDLRVLPSLEQEEGRYCLPFFGRCINRLLPGYNTRASRLASALLFEYLENKYGREIAMTSTLEEGWEGVQKDLRVKHVRNIKSRAEKMHIDRELAKVEEGSEEGVILEQVVKHTNWVPDIQVERSLLDEVEGKNMHPFDEQRMKEKLMRNTSATQEQIASVVDGVKSRILHSDAITLIIPCEKLDRIFIQEVAKNKIQLKTLSVSTMQAQNKV
ncbi:MAG: hypothetical protein FJZ57_07155 [Chlamydiae bacterium]|nr:hypothetical protein [Chlamydiota bacterium]